MQKVEDMGIADDTIMIFFSDNGGVASDFGWAERERPKATSNLPLRGGKGWLYEGGIREPLIVKWPGVVKAGSFCSEPVISTDLYPTMLEMAGLDLMPDQHMDGESLVGLLKGGQSLGRDRSTGIFRIIAAGLVELLAGQFGQVIIS